MTPDTVGTHAGLPDSIAHWMRSQRWYASKGFAPHLQRVGGWRFDGDRITVHTHFLLDRSDGTTTIYHVPITERATPLPGVDPIESREGRFLYDGVQDPGYAAILVDLMLHERSVDGAHGRREPGATDVTVTSTAVLRGEQSNTSIICEVAEGAPVMLKIFRALQHGENPDVELQSAIASTGSQLVPRSIGYLAGEWDDPREATGHGSGHLAFAQEFLPGVQDAWRVALQSASGNGDFGESARQLGEATADMHATLARVLPTREAGERDVLAMIETMRSRLESALREAPALAASRESLESILAAAATVPWPGLQRIHGDYHLGQVLLVPGRGWVIVDFEGEPLRPMWERSRLDVPLRDVAGMLRSFDYAAGSVAFEGGNAAHWALTARHAFLDGYIARSGHDVREHRVLLDAFEIDKALYEAVYEARNRPDWLRIPLAAIGRLAERNRAGVR